MTYQELIDAAIETAGLAAGKIAIIRIDYPAQTVTVITTDMRKFAVSMDDEKPQEEPRPKRVKAIKKVS